MWGDPAQNGNGQSYCGNNPVNRVDPLGLQSLSPSAAAANDAALSAVAAARRFAEKAVNDEIARLQARRNQPGFDPETNPQDAIDSMSLEMLQWTKRKLDERRQAVVEAAATAVGNYDELEGDFYVWQNNNATKPPEEQESDRSNPHRLGLAAAAEARENALTTLRVETGIELADDELGSLDLCQRDYEEWKRARAERERD